MGKPVWFGEDGVEITICMIGYGKLEKRTFVWEMAEMENIYYWPLLKTFGFWDDRRLDLYT